MDLCRAVRICPVVLAVALGVPATASAALTFDPPVQLTTGGSPRSVAVGDFNADGRADLAVANVSQDVGVMLGTGAGSFDPVETFDVEGTHTAIATGDLNGDAKLDLVVAEDNRVATLMGTGSGSFQPYKTQYTGTGTTTPLGVAVGDFNGDGRLDVATANSASGTVGILLNGGHGNLNDPTTYAAHTSPSSVAVGDLNGDGILDLAVTNSGSNDVSILQGKGDGTFNTAVDHATGTSPRSVAIGDFNGDGVPDLAVVGQSSNDVSVLLGSGGGNFGTATSYTVGMSPYSVAIGDFNGDRVDDLAVANRNSASVSVLLGDGTGSFSAPASLSAGRDTFSVVAGDLNGDGVDDIAAVNNISQTASVFVNAPTEDASATALGFGSPASLVPEGTVSAPQNVTLTNNGSAPLWIMGFDIGGADPADFFTGSDTCHAALAPGASCAVQVRFAPQAQGARAATLTVLGNAPTNASVALSGTAGPLPQGPPGPAGATGATGAAGARGPAGRVELVTCRKVTVKRHGKRVKRRRCTTKLVSGKMKFTTSARVHATLNRGSRVYAVGSGRADALVLRARRRVPAGRYTLTLRRRSGRSWAVTRIRVTIRTGGSKT